MNILHHKSYHVYNKKNVEKVRKDEEQAAAKEKEKQKKIELAESEARLNLLRKKAGAKFLNDKPTATIEHINLFKDYESTTNEENEAEEKAKAEKLDRQLTMYLDKGATAEATPWYAKNSTSIDKYSDLYVKKSDRKKRREPIRLKDDPLEYIEDKLKKEDKSNKEKKLKKRKRSDNDNSNHSNNIAELRAKRLERERMERERAKRLYLDPTEAEDHKDEPTGYNSQYNRKETLLAKQRSLSNYVGTHIWNTQEEYFDYTGKDSEKTKEINHDVLYRAGETANGIVTYTPRTLIYDLKGNFGSLQKYNRLFQQSVDIEPNYSWDQGITRIDRPVSKNRYQQELDRMDVDYEYQMNTDAVEELESSVNNWSDFNRINFHPRSINPIVTHQAEDEVNRFDNYTIGKEAYTENEKEAEIFDNNLRLFAEECDSLQGFHILTDVDDAFGGFTEGLLHDLRDEFGKLSILTYGLSDSFAYYRNERMRQKIELNRALSITHLSELSSVYVPIYTPTEKALKTSNLQPYLHFNEYSRYHTSAIIAAAIETNSLPYRLKKNSITLADSISRLSYVRNTKLATLSVSLPFMKGNTSSLPLLSHATKIEKEDVYSQTIVTRGLQINTDIEFINPLQSTFNLETLLPLPDSYPHILTLHENKVPVMTQFESGAQNKANLEHEKIS
ncbi:hypothetical protein G6F61_003495 [Rhizopus arrhizus]|nr:hypothetical protein G6F61_003495 [Rhizopus arrhizus]